MAIILVGKYNFDLHIENVSLKTPLDVFFFSTFCLLASSRTAADRAEES